MTPMSIVSFFLFVLFTPHTDWVIFHKPRFLLYVVAQWKNVSAVC